MLPNAPGSTHTSGAAPSGSLFNTTDPESVSDPAGHGFFPVAAIITSVTEQ